MCRKHGITLSADKFVISSKVTFAGFLVSVWCPTRSGKGAHHCQVPNSRGCHLSEELPRVGKPTWHLVSNLAAITDPLRKLLKKNIMWIWTPDHQAAFKATKRV
jgi:hypothetical protein